MISTDAMNNSESAGVDDNAGGLSLPVRRVPLPSHGNRETVPIGEPHQLLNIRHRTGPEHGTRSAMHDVAVVISGLSKGRRIDNQLAVKMGNTDPGISETSISGSRQPTRANRVERDNRGRRGTGQHSPATDLRLGHGPHHNSGPHHNPRTGVCGLAPRWNDANPHPYPQG